MSDKEEKDGPKLDMNKSPVSARRAKKLLVLEEFLSKQESRNTTKKVSRILKKAETDITEEERETLGQHQDIVKRIHKNKERRILSEQRTHEVEDTEEELQTKCEELAQAIRDSKKTVIYTGAGISTAASIPDYRGPQGVWTLLQRGEELQPQDLSDAEPTTTHMCITELHKQGHVTHVVSQNCDGLHLRSGLPRQVLSEVHGNMYIEICYNCKPHREYIRLFDVTENTGVRRHDTGRLCHVCQGTLRDTIVHFGEKGRLKSPYRWHEAARTAKRCDLILCLGTSLKVLKKYSCLWCMDRIKQKRPNMIIVNLQWTPKDEAASLKINGKCDDVLERVMKILGFTPAVYKRELDPIMMLACTLRDEETESENKKSLVIPDCIQKQRSETTIDPVVCSDTSEYDSDETTDSDDSYETTDSEEDETDQRVNHQFYPRNYANSVNKDTKPIVIDDDDEEKMVMLKQKCLDKSRQICYEAMQKRFGTSSTGTNNELSASNLNANHISNTNSVNQVAKLNNLQPNTVAGTQNTTIPYQGSQNHHFPSAPIGSQHLASHTSDSPNAVGQQEHSYSKCKGMVEGSLGSPGKLFNGLSYQERLAQLQTLQAQLKQLKDKQRQIQEQELLKLHHGQTHGQTLSAAYAQNLNSNSHASHVPGQVKQENSQVNYKLAQVKQEISLVQHENFQLNHPNMQIKPENFPMKHEYPGVAYPHLSKDGAPANLNTSVIQNEIGRTQGEIGLLQNELARLQRIMGGLEGSKSKLEVEIGRLEKQKKEYQEKRLEEFKKKIEGEKGDMKQRHGNEHLRLRQHCIIQHQMIEQTGLGAERLTENARWYEEQHQLLLAQQTFQLQDLLTRHQATERELHEHLHTTAKTINDNITKMNKKIPDVNQKIVPLKQQISELNRKMAELRARLVHLQGMSGMLSPESKLKHGPVISTVTSPGNTGLLSPTSLARFNEALSPNSRLNLNSGITSLLSPTALARFNEALSPNSRMSLNSGITSLLSPTALARFNEAVGPKAATGLPGLSVKCETEGLSGSAMKSPPSTDHSIAAIMSPPQRKKHESTENASAPTIPGFQELVSTLTLCDVCKTLNAYQRAGLKCHRCDDLKKQKQHGRVASVSSDHHISGSHALAASQTTVKSELSGTQNVPSVHNPQTSALSNPGAVNVKGSLQNQHHQPDSYTKVKPRTDTSTAKGNQSYLQGLQYSKSEKERYTESTDKDNKYLSVAASQHIPLSTQSSSSSSYSATTLAVTVTSSSSSSSAAVATAAAATTAAAAATTAATTPLVTKSVASSSTCVASAGSISSTPTPSSSLLSSSSSSSSQLDMTGAAPTSINIPRVPSELELSPVIPYASRNAKKNAATTPVINKPVTSLPQKPRLSIDEIKLGIKAVQESSNMQSKSDVDAKDVKPITDNEATADKYNTEASASKSNDSNKTGTKEARARVLAKPIRSHSQSEIYDKKTNGQNSEELGGKRTVRSRSQSEMSDCAGEIGLPVEEGTSGEASPNLPAEASADSSGLACLASDDSSGKAQKKRKLNRTVSVPGWFGKGLNLKKKKRY